ncbi:lysozyme [Brevundimonas sp. LM2]|uniref:lysozyme n=1 Tax=Brevundimonas sp. LM2 TaxID=1938605 RepID=UPI0009864DAE|nr:lysozyme [Brevundimonas sp. LM2]
MKVSREGIVLIKSFEGFRPRAIRRENGGWVIGYGHTRSAREGASVSEADAELLLRYDLLPVEKTVNEAGAAVLNQHQFDALTSFAFSVGVDRFQTSDVRALLSTGAIVQAADALMGWPEPVLPQAGLRRRAAERALFVADPDAPVAVSDLLAAPVGEAQATDPVPAQDMSAPPAPALAASVEAAPEPATDIATDPEPELERVPEPVPSVDPRAAAVSALLGEVESQGLSLEPAPPSVLAVVPLPPQAEPPPPAANDAQAEEPPSTEPEPVVEAMETAPERPPEPEYEPQAEPQPAPEAEPEPEPAEASAPNDRTLDPPATETAELAETTRPAPTIETPAPQSAISPSTLSAQRYAPYSAAMVGPLPFLAPARSQTPVDAQPSPVPRTEPTQTERTVETLPPAPPALAEATIIQPFAPPTDVEPLVLSAPEDAPVSAMTREAWTIEERQEAVETTEGGLFGEDLTLTLGGAPIMRHGDIEVATPASFDWSETGAFIIMGAVGLTAFGAAMAAFRLASEQTGGNETTIIAWVLAVIGAGCVGVSSFNLYRRWGLPGGDN